MELTMRYESVILLLVWVNIVFSYLVSPTENGLYTGDVPGLSTPSLNLFKEMVWYYLTDLDVSNHHIYLLY